MNILVTGSNGLIGSHLVELLIEKNLHVVGFDVSQARQTYSDSLFTFEQGNVENYTLLESIMKKHNIEHIVHCGGISHPNGAGNSPNKMVHTNIVGTSNIFEAGRNSGVEQIIYLSSAAAYGDNQMNTPLHESVLPTPTSIYGVSKVTGEYLAKVYADQFGINTVSLRVPFVYGPGRVMHEPIKYMLEKAINGDDIIEEKGYEQQLEFIYVKDVSRAIWFALQQGNLHGQVVNVGFGRLTSMSEIISVMKKLFPSTVFDIGPGDFGYDEISPLDCTKAKEILKFSPSYSIEDGIKDYYGFLKC